MVELGHDSVEVWENVLNYLMKSFETGDKTLVFRPWKVRERNGRQEVNMPV